MADLQKERILINADLCSPTSQGMLPDPPPGRTLYQNMLKQKVE
jgi:hypothetical protein